MSTRKGPRAPRDAASRDAAPATELIAIAPEADANRAGTALFGALVGLALLRAAATLIPGMYGWGLNHARFVAPALGWPLLALVALALVPRLARPFAAGAARVGDLLAGSAGAPVFAACLGAVLVLALPDQVRFVGDFLLRQGTVERASRPGVLFPQALPLDVFLHVGLPVRILEAGWLDANGVARAIGALEAGAFAALALALVRVLGLRGVAAFAAAAVLWWNGGLTLFTGYSKAFVELTVLAAAAGVTALREERRGEPPLGVGVVLALALALHRSGLGFIPVWLTAWGLWAAKHGRAGGWRRPATWVALAIPLGALAIMLPRIVATLLQWDRIHLAPKEVKEQGGPLLAAFAGLRPLDFANLLMVLAPVLPVAVAAAIGFGRGLPRRREVALLLALALPLTLVIPFIHAAQGLFRDWDDFASAGAALAVLSAWICGETLRASPRSAWLGPALVLAALVPSLQWLAIQNDLERGMGRVEAIATGPPTRTPPERGNTWDYLGIRNFRLERWDASARAFAEAAETSPSMRILLQGAVAETRRGDHAAAQRIYRRLTRMDPDNYLAWSGLAMASNQLADAATAREAARQMLRLRPNDRDATLLLESIEEYERSLKNPAAKP